MKIFSALIITAIAVHIGLFPVLELGHEVLHLLKTKLHDHAATHSHRIRDHHITITDKDHEQDYVSIAVVSFILAGFTKAELILVPATSSEDHQHCTAVIRFYNSRTIQPPGIPPAC